MRVDKEKVKAWNRRDAKRAADESWLIAAGVLRKGNLTLTHCFSISHLRVGNERQNSNSALKMPKKLKKFEKDRGVIDYSTTPTVLQAGGCLMLLKADVREFHARCIGLSIHPKLFDGLLH